MKIKIYYSIWGKKFKCRFCFDQKQITKILTPAELQKLQGEYELIRC